MSCILRHRDVQLILAYSWTRPAILVAAKGRGGRFLFLLFLHFLSFSFSSVPLFHLLYHLLYLFSLFLWETTQNNHKGWRVVKPQLNQSINPSTYIYYGSIVNVMSLIIKMRRSLSGCFRMRRFFRSEHFMYVTMDPFACRESSYACHSESINANKSLMQYLSSFCLTTFVLPENVLDWRIKYSIQFYWRGAFGEWRKCFCDNWKERNAVHSGCLALASGKQSSR